MDRKTFAACALLIAPAVLGTGCDAQPVPAPPDAAPLVLAELKQVSPGPWRRFDGSSVAPTSLERPVQNGFAPQPATLDPSQVDELKQRMQSPPGEDETETVDPYAAETAEPPYELRISDPAAVPEDNDEPGSQPAQPGQETSGGPELPDASQPDSGDSSQAVPSTAPRVLTPAPVSQAVTSQRLPDAAVTSPVEQSPLPWANAGAMTPEMRAVLDEAEQRIRHGFRLAERDALYLAKEEFIGALELIAQANDMQLGTQFHTDSLDAGLLALEESREFVRPRTVGKRLDLDRVVSGHRTPVLKNEPLEKVPPAIAARRYYAFAQEQLSGAAAGESRSSIALYGLGKIVVASNTANASERLEGTARAMVLHQAALMADQKNFRAANELGVILAKKGDLPHARDLLAHSVRLAPHPVPYRNLAIVLENMGEPQLAQRAVNEAVVLEQRGLNRAGPSVQWVDATTFASTAPPSNTSLPPVAAKPPAASPPAPQQEPVTTARKSGVDWPWTRR